MADQFLSCDGNFVHVPKDHFKNKKEKDTNGNAMISISTISASLSTDDSALLRRPQYTTPRCCCCLKVTTMSIFALTTTCCMTLAAFIFCVVRIVQDSDREMNKECAIAIISVVTTLILFFSALYAWGIFTERAGYLLPNIALTTFLLCASIAVCIFLFVTTADEVASESKNTSENKETIIALLAFRFALVALCLIQSLFIVTYIRSYLHIRRISS